MIPELILLVGNIGSGKSTLAQKLAEERKSDSIIIDMDNEVLRFQNMGCQDWENLMNRELNKLVFSSIDSNKRVIIDGCLLKKNFRKNH